MTAIVHSQQYERNRQLISTSLDGGIAIITLERAASRNALATEDWAALQTAITEVVSTRARVILLQSALPSAFCAGSDLKAMEALLGRPDRVAEFRLQMRSAIEAVAAAPIPAIANIQGDCFGAGVALALACDIRVVGDGVRFGVTPAKLGLSYPVEDVARLVKSIGTGHASRLLMSADTISAVEAHEMGLVEILGGPDEALRIATAIASNAPHSVKTAKQLIGAIGSEAQLAFDAIFDGFFASAAFVEGLKAFKEKRRPVYPDESRPDA